MKKVEKFYDFSARQNKTSTGFLVKSRRWKETVEVEREGVEFFIPAVSFECPEFNPPWHPSISGAVLVVKSVVEQHPHNQRNSWR